MGRSTRRAAALARTIRTLLAAARAAARRFIDQYRSYVINYNLGKDMVARYVESQSGRVATRRRAPWACSTRLLSSPRLPWKGA